ncbi:MAG TPA: DUF255 domain-containing protein, partial [Nitrospiria bacterium]|nr:DUF255 domain-containing protein [Nitrospiria bacterium]
MEKHERIQWQVWGSKVFEQARADKKPIFLSISATWCHWCHVMDEEGFDHPEVIRRLNRDFIPVRVDSDKRPDINSRYNMGGWPTVVILDSEGRVSTGGTYLPTSQLLEMVSRGELKPAKGVSQAPEKSAGKRPGSGRAPDSGAVQHVLNWVERAFDRDYGGFGPPPKFPHPWILELIIKNPTRVNEPQWRQMASRTLDVMRDSELYDREDGGFFRYATRGDWDRPHFEKLLGTNSRMLSLYLDAYQILKEPTYLATARGVLDYLDTYLSPPDHPGYYGSQTADEEYYSSSEEARLNLPPPPVDQTLYTDLNAEAAGALFKAGDILNKTELTERAVALTGFLWKNLREPERGMRHCADGTSPLTGFLSDQVHMVSLLLTAYERKGEGKYLERGLLLLEIINRTLWDERSGGYRDLPREADGEGFLKLEMKPLTENALAAMALTRLSYMTGEERHFKQAEKVLAFLSGIYKPYKHHGAVFAVALEQFISPPETVVIVGRRSDKTWGGLLEAAHRRTAAWKVVVPLDLADDRDRIERLGYPPA